MTDSKDNINSFSSDHDEYTDSLEERNVEPYAKTPSPPIPILSSEMETLSASTSRLGHSAAQQKMHSESRQLQAARNSIASISAKSNSPTSKEDKLISNGPHNNEITDDDVEVEKVLESEMVSDEEISARDLEAVVTSAYFDIIVILPLLCLPFLFVYFFTSADSSNIITEKKYTNPVMEFVRYNIFAVCAYALYIVFDVLSLVIPEGILLLVPVTKDISKTRKFMRNQLQMAINIRHYFALSTWLISLIVLGAYILYNSVFTSPYDLINKMTIKNVPNTKLPDAEKIEPKIIAQGKNLITQRYIEVTLVLMAVFSFVLAIEKYLMQMIKLGFHRQAFAGRISHSNRRFGYLLKLYEAVKFGKPRVLSNSSSSLLDIDSAADLSMDKGLHLTSIHRAKSIAKLIFRTLLGSKSNNQKYLLLEDLEKWTSSPKETFECLDMDGSGQITEVELEESVVDIYTSRDNLNRGLKSNGKVVEKLDTLFVFIAFLLGGLLCSPIFDVGVGNFIAALGVLSTGFGFLFNSTAKSCFESLLFVFIQHPFDVGDRVTIDDENFVIEDIEIFTTKMIRWDGVLVYIANSSLCSKVIQNIRRSENQIESLALKIKSDNPTESLWNFRQELETELKDHEYNFTGEVDLANLDKLPSNGEPICVTVLAQVRGNFQNSAKRNARKAEFLKIVENSLKRSNLTKS